jgi:hypothetical protein
LNGWVKEMIQKIVKKCNVDNCSSIREDLAYWLSRPPEERVSTVDYLRRQYHGNTARLQRSARVIQFIMNKRAVGRKKDLADLEALGEQ